MSRLAGVGRTKDGTWQLGVRRTAAGWSVQDAWETGLELVAADPAAGEATSRTELVVARFPYAQPGWPRHGSLQLRVMPAASGATISIALEGMPSEEDRRVLLSRWTAAVEGAIAA